LVIVDDVGIEVGGSVAEPAYVGLETVDQASRLEVGAKRAAPGKAAALAVRQAGVAVEGAIEMKPSAYPAVTPR